MAWEEEGNTENDVDFTEKEEESETKSELVSWGEALLHALLFVGILYLLAWPVRVEGVSMEDTFIDGDMAAMSRIITKLGKINVDDIVVFKLSSDRNISDNHMIKRVIGKPGDRVKIEDGFVYVNDTLREHDPYTYAIDDSLDVMLNEGEYFVLGDNRDKSEDSRSFGFVYKDEIVGRVFIRVFPFNKISLY